MSNKDLFQRAKDLKLPIGKYALFGGAPICVRGLRECRDIDIVVAEDLWNELKSKPEWKIKTTDKGDECLENGEIELWKNWRPENWDITKLIEEAEIINDLPFVKLERVLEWKKMNAREKDLKDVEIIEKFMSDIQ